MESKDDNQQTQPQLDPTTQQDVSSSTTTEVDTQTEQITQNTEVSPQTEVAPPVQADGAVPSPPMTVPEVSSNMQDFGMEMTQ